MSRRRSRRRRRVAESDDALELFLDAMSNLFGGVVFVAVAVVVLLRLTVPPTAPSVPAPEAVSAATVRAEIADLRTLLSALGPAPEPAEVPPAPDQPPRPPAVPLESIQDQVARATAQQRTLTERLAQVRDQLLDAQKKLNEARERSPHRLRLPRFRASTLQEFPVLLRDGRLVPIFLTDARGPTTRPNAPQLDIDADALTVAPRPGAGVSLGDDATARAALARLVAPLDPTRHFVALAVWPDSFAAAETARDFLAQRGFEYGLTFVADGQAVPFRATGGVQ